MPRPLRATPRRLISALLLIGLLMLYAASFVSAAPDAVVTIDHFDAAQGPVVASLGNPAGGSVSGPNVLGTERDVRVTVLSGSPGTASMQAITSDLLHSQDTGIIAQTLIQWDGVDGSITLNPSGLGGVDLTQAGTQNGLAISVLLNDLPIDLKFTIYSGPNSSTATISLPGGQTGGSLPIDYYVPFGAFTTLGGSGANFSSVGAVELLIDGKTDASDLTVHDIRTVSLDWGDLPETYGTTFAANGPRHVVGSLFLGPQIDPYELNGLPSADALADDKGPVAGPDDEDGVTPTPGVLWQRKNGGGSVNVIVTGGPGCLSGWADWNNNGNMTDPTENILVNVPVNTGTSTLTFAVPVQPGSGSFYTRFRLYAQDAGGGCTSAKSPTGSATNGEVEDYRWSFGPNAVNVSAFSGSAAPAALPLVGALVATTMALVAGLWKVFRG